MLVEHVMRSSDQRRLQMAENRHPEVRLNVMKTIREQLEERVQDAPTVLLEHLGQQLIQKAFDAKGLELGVDQ